MGSATTSALSIFFSDHLFSEVVELRVGGGGAGSLGTAAWLAAHR